MLRYGRVCSFLVFFLATIGFTEEPTPPQELLEKPQSPLPSLFSGDANPLPQKEDPKKWEMSKEGSSTLWKGTVGNADVSIQTKNPDPFSQFHTAWEKENGSKDQTAKKWDSRWESKKNSSSEFSFSIEWPSKH